MGKEIINNKKHFVTLFPNFIDAGFTKDVAMIPYTLEQKFNYMSTLVCVKPKEPFEEHGKVAGLNIHYLDSEKNIFCEQVRYIIKYAKQIDVLNMYHMSVQNSLLLLYIYKLFNSKGIAYLKLDLDLVAMKQHEKITRWKIEVIKLLQKKVDIISAESKIICERYSALFGEKVYYIPDGYFPIDEADFNSIEKENTILTVGRLGTRQKATEVLLEAFAKTARYHEWKLVLVGNVEEEFYYTINQFFRNYPELKARVSFTGMIGDKEALNREYRKAKIFVLPSRWESFGIVLVEALKQGCYLITTDQVPSANEITDDEKFGKIVEVDNVEMLAEEIFNAIQIVDRNNIENIQNYALTFSWECICNEIDKIICGKQRK